MLEGMRGQAHAGPALTPEERPVEERSPEREEFGRIYRETARS